MVTQPPAARGRGRKLLPSPVAERALARDFPSSLIWSPEKASEVNSVRLKSLTVVLKTFEFAFTLRKWLTFGMSTLSCHDTYVS